MKILLVLVFLTGITLQAFSQGSTVTGRVTDGDSGMPGVNVQIKGTISGTVTDINGDFSLNAKPEDVLVFSFIGFATQEITVGNQSTINVTLVEDIETLQEVVIIGYGETTVKDATGAVTAVSAKDFNGGVISSPEQLISGKTAGVQITSTSGSPGDGVNIRIRGTTSIRSNNNPLFVVDGVPLSGGTQPASSDVGYGTTSDTNPLNFINPSDIESMSILKDASATAIYGSRGANGVVIITTKSGRGQGGFEFSSTGSISTPASKYDLLGREDFLKAIEQYGGDPVARDEGADTDWQDFILRTTFSHKQNLSYSKAFTTGSIRASFGYENQQGIIEDSFMKRLTARINGRKTFMNEKLEIGLTSTFSNVKRGDPPLSGSAGFAGDLLGAAYSANPTWPTDPDHDTGGQRSPANMLEYFLSEGATDRILTNLSVDYKITEDLIAKVTYGLDWSDGDRLTLIQGNARNAGDGVGDYGQGQIDKNENLSNLFEGTLNYKKKVGVVDIEAVGGYSIQSFRNQWYWSNARGFANPNSFSAMETEINNSHDAVNAAAEAAASGSMNIINNFGVDASGGFVAGLLTGLEEGQDPLVLSTFNAPSGMTVEAIAANFYDQTDYLQSYFARGNFSINNKYLITATVRADGSSQFGENNKYGVFPSGALAWKLHEEAFFPDFFSSFKLRAGYGIVGNQDGLGHGNAKRRARYDDVSVEQNRTIIRPGLTTQGSINPDLKWESTSQLSVGIDFGILNEKLYGSIDYYNKQTSDLLLKYVAAQPSLETQIFKNLDAIVENKGWELSLTYVAVENDDAGLTISGNISQNHNMIKDFAGELDAGTIYGQGLTGAYAQRLSGGHPLFTYHLREFEGFDENGQPIGDNQTYIGKSALPEWTGGLSINANYKNFSLAAYMSGQFGQYIYNNTQNAFFTAGSIQNGRNVTKDVLTSGESGFAEAAVSTRFLSKGDFVRMQTLQLGYNVPVSGDGFIRSLRFNITAQNLFLITNYSGLDPEVSTNPADDDLLNDLPTLGIDYTSYPRPRVFSFGLNLSF